MVIKTRGVIVTTFQKEYFNGTAGFIQFLYILNDAPNICNWLRHFCVCALCNHCNINSNFQVYTDNLVHNSMAIFDRTCSFNNNNYLFQKATAMIATLQLEISLTA